MTQILDSVEIRGKFKINVDWNEKFLDTNSKEFHKLRVIVRYTILRTLKYEEIDLDIQTFEVQFRYETKTNKWYQSYSIF